MSSPTACIFCGHEKAEHGTPICGVQDIILSFPPGLSEPCNCEKIGIVKFPESVDGQPYWRARKQLTCQEWWEQRNPQSKLAQESHLRRFLLTEFSLTYRGFMTGSSTNLLWKDHERRQQQRQMYELLGLVSSTPVVQ